MSFRAEKRAFLVRVLGEERVRALERDLPAAEKMLEDAGIAFKADGEMIGLPLGGATSFGAADVYQKASATAQETLDLVDIFRLITSNILADDSLEVADRPALLEAAAGEFGRRLQGLGTEALKELAPRAATALKAAESGVQPYVDDLVGVGTGVKALDDASTEAVKGLEDSPAPASGIVADLLRQGPIQS